MRLRHGKLRALADRLHADRDIGAKDRRERLVSEAVAAWRSAGKGEGNAAFFRLACALAAAGVERVEAQQILHAEAGFARSPSERRGEIKSLMRRYDMLSRGRPRAA